MFIVLEGPDGVGKTTQCHLLAERLTQELKVEAVSLREPTDGVHGRRIRQAARDHARPSPEIETDWFMSDRQEDVAVNINPALRCGCYVVLDRYYYSTAAYQGARDLSIAGILKRSRMFCTEPDLCFVLLGSVERALERIEVSRGDTPDAFEAASYQRDVADIFRRLITMEAGKLIEIDADRTIEEVHDEIWRRVVQECKESVVYPNVQSQDLKRVLLHNGFLPKTVGGSNQVVFQHQEQQNAGFALPADDEELVPVAHILACRRMLSESQLLPGPDFDEALPTPYKAKGY